MKEFYDFCSKYNCDDVTIKKCYRQNALKLHPDKGGNEEDFKRLQNEYERLSFVKNAKCKKTTKPGKKPPKPGKKPPPRPGKKPPKPGKKPPPRPSKDSFVINPDTGRCIRVGGVAHKKIPKNKYPLKKCKMKLNPATGRYNRVY
jgi:hypothetical protein